MKFFPTFAKYGGRRALIASSWYRILMNTGIYSKWQIVRWSSVNRLIFICKGNICRSAYAHAYTQARHPTIKITSAGLEAGKGTVANPMASTCATTRGIDMSRHRTQPISDLEFDSGDLVIAFEPSQLIALEQRYPEVKVAQLTLMGLHSKPIHPYIHDPYGLDHNYFEKCFRVIEMNIDAIINATNTAS